MHGFYGLGLDIFWEDKQIHNNRKECNRNVSDVFEIAQINHVLSITKENTEEKKGFCCTYYSTVYTGSH